MFRVTTWPGGVKKEASLSSEQDAAVLSAPLGPAHATVSSDGGRLSPGWLSLALELGICVLMGLAVASTQGFALLPAAGALALWGTLSYHHGVGTLSPVRPRIRPLGQNALISVGTVGVAVAIGVVEAPALTTSVLGILVATLVASWFHLYRRSRTRRTRTLLVGDRVAVASQASTWASHPGVEVVAVCVLEPDLDDSDYPHDVFGVPVIRSIDDVPGTVREMQADVVIVVPGPGFTTYDMETLSWSLEHMATPVAVAGFLDKLAPHRLTPSVLGGRLVLDLAPSRRSLWLRTCKSIADRTAGLVLLVLASPLIAVLGLAVRLESAGPALFKQERIGEGGRRFVMYKLRTMCNDAAQVSIPLQRTAGNEVLFKMKQDPRVTRLGRLLRRASLDELPQLLNVAKGEMSLIGPRPALPEEVQKYDNRAMRRVAVRPGITGLWQISGRSDLSWDESIALDLHYVDNWRMADDFAIAMRTLGAVFRSRGAY